MDSSAFSFQFLSPDLIVKSLSSIGIYINSGLTALNSYENRVYQFHDEEHKRYVAKFYRPHRWSREQIVEEHKFTEQLYLADIPVVSPIAHNNNTLHEYQGYLFALFPSFGGRPYEIDNRNQMESVGTLIGRIHQIGATQTFSYRPIIGLEEYLYRPQDILLSSAYIPKNIQLDLKTVLAKLIKTVEQYWHTDWQPIRLHADCHAGNILWRDSATLVDFDDSRNGPAIQDLWMLLYGNQQAQRLQLEELIELYQEFYNFDKGQLKLIEPLRTMRMVHQLAWIVERWKDPAFPTAFSWITDVDYWHRQLSEFNQQINALTAPPLQLMSMC
ncbi:serine/threonine protein kinase [Gilliamella sp. B2776]|uniref:serine/threonine protein kinase n=1 Tax=unclassified Gilliamella TaxID=2685620 RepID=UPI00226983D2|nr:MULTISPECIES: serine/threonine protein kinase [unclassified Gilliamella]MCX8648918.1 serine/threonine protein kinase [Gilliamella sp. B2779]MCX8653206.1 serine/threonine protein kinase [Gilliamella sp. B2737]MCX8655466.1 serine/threonine protein kinase [Gilliamella sp. B2894]MCX8664231.1 serine/threonine protein kinase [Gilliamella sp. B2887]MCX8690730.1 serine/threonine protein kinase [Gilliamella sp. B2776]